MAETRADIADAMLTRARASFRPHVVLSSEDDEETEMPGVYVIKRHKLVHTLWAIIVGILVQLCLIGVTFIVPWYCRKYEKHQWYCSNADKEHPAMPSLLPCVHVCVWLLMTLIHLYIRRQHIISRRYGYSMFYRQTVSLRRLPFYVTSFFTVMVLIVLLLNTTLNLVDTAHLKEFHLVLRIAISIQASICLLCLTVLMYHTVQFNRHRYTPDVFRESTLNPDSASYRVVLGFRDKMLVEELLEKQCDKIVQMTNRCQTLTRALFDAHQALQAERARTALSTGEFRNHHPQTPMSDSHHSLLLDEGTDNNDTDVRTPLVDVSTN